MAPPKERVQNVFPWGVFQNEMKLLQMIEGDRLGDFSKLLPVLFPLFIFPDSALWLQEHECGCGVMGHTHPPHSVSLLPDLLLG